VRGGGAPSMGSNGPSFHSAPSGTARSFSGPGRSFSGSNRFAGSNNWRGGDWRGDWRRHGRHFRGVFPFVGAYAYTYPYDDDYYGYDRCAYVDPGSWWWRRYCAPYSGYTW
jgi:hypothetical protein